jgi:hypothetical protein
MVETKEKIKKWTYIVCLCVLAQQLSVLHAQYTYKKGVYEGCINNSHQMFSKNKDVAAFKHNLKWCSQYFKNMENFL